MSGKFYSSLVINTKNFPAAHQVFRPRYNKQFFKRITSNIDQLEHQINQRGANNSSLSRQNLDQLRQESQKLVQLRERLEKTPVTDSKYAEVLGELESIEDRLMPTVVAIPNRMSKNVPENDRLVDEIKSNFLAKQNLVKVLSHRKLSYINNCYSKSVVGPNSHYYFGIGAKLQYALSDYFTRQLEEANFIPVSGLCLTKSAVVEAANSSHDKDYSADCARILSDEFRYTSLHLSEASREALVGFISTIGPIASNNPLKLMMSGASYRLGSDWFDGDDKRITQIETVHALVLNPSIEQYSIKEYEKVCHLIWSSYKKLELPARLIHCSANSLYMNEFDAHRIEIWLPSRDEWIQGARISHYRDYITVRAGMKRGHLVDSMVYDGQLLVAAVIENRQTSLGKFIIPEVLQSHLIHLTADEKTSYCPRDGEASGQSATNESLQAIKPHLNCNKADVMMNHEQRRYLVKRKYFLSNSQAAKKMIYRRNLFSILGANLSVFLFIGMIIDWHSIWYDYLPDNFRRFLYDGMWRPVRRSWHWLICAPDRQPYDISYEELDRAEFEMTRGERSKKIILATTRRKGVEAEKGDH